ncbi:MAG: luciferase family protein, partial [Chthoniobacteraceae bacterium]
MFRFVVRHLRWLARVPGLPQYFDTMLLTWTALFHRRRLRAMEAIEEAVLQMPGVRLCVHRLGGMEFVCGERELGHLQRRLLDRLNRPHPLAMKQRRPRQQHRVKILRQPRHARQPAQMTDDKAKHNGHA